MIDGAAITIAGGPCATRGYCIDPSIPVERFVYETFNPETDKIPPYTDNWAMQDNAT